MSISISGDLATTITAIGGLVTGVGTLVLQIMQAKRSIANGKKIDENTRLTQEVHSATAAIVENTGTHKILDP